MAAVEVTISGMLYDKINRTTQNVVLIGEATLTGLGVGGGPIIPPGGGPPLYPAHPIVLPPEGGWPHPEHPIVIPPDKPPTEPPPPIDTNWQWGWNVANGWHPVWVPGDKPQPVPPPA